MDWIPPSISFLLGIKVENESNANSTSMENPYEIILCEERKQFEILFPCESVKYIRKQSKKEELLPWHERTHHCEVDALHKWRSYTFLTNFFLVLFIGLNGFDGDLISRL